MLKNNKQKKAIPSGLEGLKDNIINQTFLIGAVVTVLMLIRQSIYDPENYLSLALSAASLFYVVAIFRKRLSLQFKVWFLVFCMYTVMTLFLGQRGFLASAKIYMVIVPIFLSFIVPYRQALASLLVFLATYLVIGHLHCSGALDSNIDDQSYTQDIVVWYTESFVMILVAIGLLYIGHKFNGFVLDLHHSVHRRERQLLRSDQKYRSLFDSSNDAIILIKDRGFLDWNSKACELFECDEAYFETIEPYQLSPDYQPDGRRSRQVVTQHFEKLFSEGPQVFDWQHVRPNGELFFVSVSLTLANIEKDTYIQAVLRDISEKKATDAELERYRQDLEQLVRERTAELDATVLELQERNNELSDKGAIIHEQNTELKEALNSVKHTQTQLLQSEKMASLGVLTAGVAHEINNPLNYIQGGYSGLTKYFRDQGIEDPDIIELLQNIRLGIDRSVSIVSGLNQFSRNNETYDEDCYIHKILDNCLLMLNSQLKRRVQVVKEYAPCEIIVPGNVGKIHQVFINLLTNASHAIDEEGEIKVITSCHKDSVMVQVVDNGVGISEENLSKITDPFFTTKDPGQGTGLGLSISYSIIQEHKGTLQFESKLSEGTKVNVRFPMKSSECPEPTDLI